jgi:putative transposase
MLANSGRIAVRWSRPLAGTIKTVTLSRDADGYSVWFACADVPVQALRATGQETGIDLGIEAFATLSEGTRIFHPGWYRQAERSLKMAHAAGAPPAAGRSPQDGAPTGTQKRCDRSRTLAGGQAGEAAPSGPIHS